MFKKLRYLKYYANFLLNNWTTSKDSYAQHGEDRLVELLLPEGVNSFIDIGANDGVLFSNTFKFAKSGAHGLCVEPSKNSYKKLRLNHLFHRNIICINTAISNTNGKIYLRELGYESTLSSVSTKKSNNSYAVECLTFNNILENNPKFIEVDLLTIDAEGHEKEILQGLTKTNFKAKIIIIESDKTQSDALLKFSALRKYNALYINGVNTILIHENEIFNELKTLPKGFVKC